MDNSRPGRPSTDSPVGILYQKLPQKLCPKQDRVQGKIWQRLSGSNHSGCLCCQSYTTAAQENILGGSQLGPTEHKSPRTAHRFQRSHTISSWVLMSFILRPSHSFHGDRRQGQLVFAFEISLLLCCGCFGGSQTEAKTSLLGFCTPTFHLYCVLTEGQVWRTVAFSSPNLAPLRYPPLSTSAGKGPPLSSLRGIPPGRPSGTSVG